MQNDTSLYYLSSSYYLYSSNPQLHFHRKRRNIMLFINMLYSWQFMKWWIWYQQRIDMVNAFIICYTPKNTMIHEFYSLVWSIVLCVRLKISLICCTQEWYSNGYLRFLFLSDYDNNICTYLIIFKSYGPWLSLHTRLTWIVH